MNTIEKRLYEAIVIVSRHPVLMVIHTWRPRARRFLRLIEKHTGRSGPPHDSFCTVAQCLDRSTTMRVLHADGSMGANYVASLVENNPLVHQWVIEPSKTDIRVRAGAGMVTLFSVKPGYDTLGVYERMPPPVLRVNDYCQLPFLVENRFLRVCGPSLNNAAHAVVLLRLVLLPTRNVYEPDLDSPVDPPDDERISELLRDSFSDKPRAVAEAIMALKKFEVTSAHPLLRVLERPEFRILAQQVQYELTGV